MLPPDPHLLGEHKIVSRDETQVQEFWSEKSKATREQRQAQYARNERVENMLQPIKAAYEASKYSLSSLQEEDVSTMMNQPNLLCSAVMQQIIALLRGEAVWAYWFDRVVE